jgi:AhpD family alkylhydroperoxidase
MFPASIWIIRLVQRAVPSIDVSDYVIPEQRIDLRRVAPKAHSAMINFATAVGEKLDPVVHELVKLRISQLNGCSYCVDKHTREATAAGEDSRRLHAVAAWREAPFFTAKERAALELAEAVTLLPGRQDVPDKVWKQAEEQFEEEELAHLVLAIAAMNALNRSAVTSRLRLPTHV